jgi:hypothetical protein
MKKICTICKQELPIENFYKDASRKGGFSHRCKNCEKEKVKQYDAPFKDKIKELLDIEKSKGCHYCPESTPECLDFHHRNPKDKKYSVSTMLFFGHNHTIEKVKAELEKCIVICANCHRKLHAGKL